MIVSCNLQLQCGQSFADQLHNGWWITTMLTWHTPAGWAGTRRNISPTHTYRGHQSSLIC